MRWEDERYVRIYTRDTPDWLAMQWQGRAVFYELSRKVDRSGFVPLGKSGNRGLAGCLHMPLDVVEAGVAELLTDGCVVAVDGGLLVRNFLEAQEARQSDGARKRTQRERARNEKRDGVGHDVSRAADGPDESGQPVTKRDQVSQNVTESHEVSRAVTDGHDRSQGVTPSLAVPSRTEPDQTHTSRERAPARVQDEDDRRMPVPAFSEADLAALLGELPALADLVADPALVGDLYGGFRMAAGDTATVDLARAAVGACAAAEDLRSMPVHQQRERLGRYLGNARKYNRPAPRESAPESVTDEQRVVLAVFGEEWTKKKRRDFVQATGDERHAAALVEAAKEHAARHKIRPRDIFRHWAAAYVRDTDKFVADQDHPLRILPSRLTSYGLPAPAAPKKPAAPARPQAALVGPPADLVALATGGTP